MTSDPIDTQARAAVSEARDVAATLALRLVVGLIEYPDGSGAFTYQMERDAGLDLSFMPCWLVTPDGEVVALRAEGVC